MTRGVDGADIVILGAGFSGMVMALEARRAGFRDILVLEKGADWGGTWRENTYPGVACDIPSHLYALARHPKADWSRRYAPGAEILAYLRGVARDEGLYPLTRFGAEVVGADWDAGRWRVRLRDGSEVTARVLVPALGPLHVPRMPEVPGLEGFPGPVIHSAQWDGAAELSGKAVAVVGSGSSAGQIVPELARVAAHLTLYQRSAPWVVPHFDFPVPGWLRWLYGAVPGLRAADRALSFSVQEAKHAVFRMNPVAAGLVSRIALAHMWLAVRDPALRQRLTPDYAIGCKRILLSNRWYPALVRPNVEVVSHGVARVEGDRVIAADGSARRADALVFATGFDAIPAMTALPVRGRGGRSLGEAWGARVEAYLGSGVAGFPNLFILLGPNTALGHNSIVLMAEAQAAHVVGVLSEMRAQGIGAVEPRAAVRRAYVDGVQERLARTVWQAGGCTSWYKAANGSNPTIWPGTVREFRRTVRRSGLADYAPVG